MHIGSKQGLTQPKGLVGCLGRIRFERVGPIQVSGQYRIKPNPLDLFFKLKKKNTS